MRRHAAANEARKPASACTGCQLGAKTPVVSRGKPGNRNTAVAHENRAFAGNVGVEHGSHVLLAMQKVVSSNPISRLRKDLPFAGLSYVRSRLVRLPPRTMNGQSPPSRADAALEKTRRRLFAGDLEGVGTIERLRSCRRSTVRLPL